MVYLNAQVGYPIVALSDLVPLEEFKYSFSTMSRYLPKIMVEAGIVSSTSEVRRNRPDLCKIYPDDMTACEEITWGKKKLYVVVGKKIPVNIDTILSEDPNVQSWIYLGGFDNPVVIQNVKNQDKLCTASQRKYNIPIVTDSFGNNIPASGNDYCQSMIINYC